MINSKITKTSQQQTTEEKLFKLLESMDWKLWEMYNLMKENAEVATKAAPKTKTTKKTAE